MRVSRFWIFHFLNDQDGLQPWAVVVDLDGTLGCHDRVVLTSM
jgi:hypothetical protein